MRLFLALNLPPPVRHALWQATAPLRDLELPVKWVPAEGMHLTLKFLGEVAPERDAELGAALGRAKAGARAVSLALGGFGAFPDVTRPRVVWAGVASEPALELLAHQVEQAFGPLGFPTEARAFRPHLTLGRTARTARPRDFAALPAALDQLRFAETVLVETLDLMQSTFQSNGAVYNVRHSERLP
ncbi:MAG TPA: RNA 2',3'-cyclic phosphodiesterase [Gemmatimonadales bacterium]|nr:RNA 2',3'-cyclic phosphodiesterase [Gemmatimonadales bacterium]